MTESNNYLGSNLVTTLSSLNMNDFTHFLVYFEDRKMQNSQV